MRLDEVIQNSNKPTLSFELFPAHDDKAKAKLDKVIDKLTALEPNFVSVTFGAGGSTREGSYQLAKQLKEDKNLKVLPYFAGFGLGPNDICAVLNRYRDLGIENLLVVRGDRPAEDEGFSPHPQSFKHASDLLGFIGERYAFCLGAAGYPEGHVEASSKEKDLEYLKLKTQKGASFVIANYFYDNRYFFDFIERVRKIGVTAPILAGVMPIYNVKMMENLASLCGATITSEIREAISALPEDDKEALSDFGVDFAVKQCRGLIENGVQGVHIYTMDRAKSAEEIVRRLRSGGLL